MAKAKTPAGMVLVDENSVEALAVNIANMAQSLRMMEDNLERRAIVALIQEYAPRRISKDDVNCVLSTIANLDNNALKKKRK